MARPWFNDDSKGGVDKGRRQGAYHLLGLPDLGRHMSNRTIKRLAAWAYLTLLTVIAGLMVNIAFSRSGHGSRDLIDVPFFALWVSAPSVVPMMLCVLCSSRWSTLGYFGLEVAVMLNFCMTTLPILAHGDGHDGDAIVFWPIPQFGLMLVGALLVLFGRAIELEINRRR